MGKKNSDDVVFLEFAEEQDIEMLAVVLSAAPAAATLTATATF